MRWDDHFYVDLVHDTAKWLYLAPAGGTFVCNEFPITLLESMLQKYPDLSADVIFSYIEYNSYRREAMPGTCLYALVNKEIASSDSHQLQNILVKFFC